VEVALHPFGEVLPRAENYVTTEGTPTDQYGVPLPKIVYSTGENERRMVSEMYDTMEEIMHEAKAEIFTLDRTRTGANGSAIHEHGTCRMGDDAKTSVVDPHHRTHDVSNLFIVDGSSFVTACCQPTCTIQALAYRAADHIAREARKAVI